MGVWVGWVLLAFLVWMWVMEGSFGMGYAIARLGCAVIAVH
jgi:hypothetical protein